LLSLTRVPVVKFRERKSGVYCDISFKNMMGIYNSQFIRQDFILKKYNEVPVPVAIDNILKKKEHVFYVLLSTFFHNLSLSDSEVYLCTGTLV
jgi:hypothetical protein